jgi:hypothetical protein
MHVTGYKEKSYKECLKAEGEVGDSITSIQGKKEEKRSRHAENSKFVVSDESAAARPGQFRFLLSDSRWPRFQIRFLRGNRDLERAQSVFAGNLYRFVA